MREKLIELLSEVQYLGGLEEKVADHLIANGVAVLPCKVGQTLHFLYNCPYADKPDLTPRIYKTGEWYFDIDEKGVSIRTRHVLGYFGKYHYFLGKTVFLTREEAEAALKEDV